MKLRHVDISNFRGHRSLALDFDTGMTCVRGANESGKTSIIEAVMYALYGGKALRTSLENAVTWGEDASGSRILLSEEREPMLYFTDNCEHMIRTLPEQERDMTDFEDIDTAGEDHAVDELRYVATSRPSMGILLKDVTKPARMTECERDFLMAQSSGDSSMQLDSLSAPVSADMGYLAEEIGGLRVHIAR